MTPQHVRDYCDLIETNFVEAGGKLYSRCDFEGSIPPGPPEPTTVMENTLNSERFRFFPRTTFDGVLKNHALASAVRVVWQSRLATLFPHRSFRCFVSNEYALWPHDDDPAAIGEEAVETVLRLWSLPADDLQFDETYMVDQLAPDRVLWREYDASRLLRLSEVFDVINGGMHPAKMKALQARWHAI